MISLLLSYQQRIIHANTSIKLHALNYNYLLYPQLFKWIVHIMSNSKQLNTTIYWINKHCIFVNSLLLRNNPIHQYVSVVF